MRKKFLIFFMILITVLTLIFVFIMRDTLLNSMMIQSEKNLTNELLLAKRLSESIGESNNLQEIAEEVNKITGARVTIIDIKGTVIAETDEEPEVMSNHLNRGEVIEAIKTQNPSISTRYSNTVRTDFLYAAVPIKYNNNNYILRISRRLEEIQIIDSQIKNYGFFSIGIAFLFALILSLFITKKITDPIYNLTNAAREIEKGNYGKKIYSNSKDEIGFLTQAFNQMSIELKSSIEQINQRNIQLKSILNNTVNGIIAVDVNKKVLLINKISFEILEIPTDYVTEKESIYNIIRNKEIVEMIDKTITDKLSQTKELNYIHLDKILKIYINPIISEKEDIIGSIIILHDITKIKKLEKMRSDFVSNVSHELKTPLTSIKGFLEILKEDSINDQEKTSKFLNIIDIEVDRLSRLISDILELSKIENLEKDYDVKSVKINKLAEDVINMLKYKAINKNIEIKLLSPKDYWLKANPDRIKQMFINLIDNAIKFTEEGEIKISFESNDKWIKIKVSDTGIGFDESHKDRMFERFYRTDEGRSRSLGGTGLGLSIVKHIVMLYKGEISVNSEIGKGTEFEILFPEDNNKSK